uniref:Uncharacterized protein n=1 Tax=Percolomonas cosmopolitus TaxID=63605 RepID=A0A7S1KRK3_9EUKA|mmetsp:Transcript_638/g.2236  ORF Transcript_638/g.2236 Transcript_638/m.2236 type:complete len:150 (+) Transcript_638:403-852(+)|eukprot:CAMPEP_0117447166 /NCGR_PEP_ID=MMETSP0759-20121206/6730_1 /TAXON_ID=63605 /ORGANISM="Percolomonas cosmopolitus, Strain WS" /LENGTH=149 /DNA_ID=CAMNT_0005239483 /DNA_START=158 /DNA_END=607 /DNA_ORIENTATION=-
MIFAESPKILYIPDTVLFRLQTINYDFEQLKLDKQRSCSMVPIAKGAQNAESAQQIEKTSLILSNCLKKRKRMLHMGSKKQERHNRRQKLNFLTEGCGSNKIQIPQTPTVAPQFSFSLPKESKQEPILTFSNVSSHFDFVRPEQSLVVP